MSNLFSGVLNMSMTGSVVILIVMLARLILKRSPKIFSYALWSVVLFRLLCQVAFTAPVSVLNAFEAEVKPSSESTSIVYYIPAQVEQPSEFTFVSVENQSGRKQDREVVSNQTELDIMTVFSGVWITGVAVMLLYSAAQYVLLKRKLVGNILYRGNVYLADYIDTPFVLGVFRPKIYLPTNIPSNERKYIIAHERHHIRRCDHIIKLLAYCALCIHWFNPLVWAAFILAGKDMEMSCDEAVIKQLGPQIRADYSASLLRLATHKKIIAGMPLAFGEGDTKGRVLNMAKWKKPKLWVSILCILLCIGVLVACAVNPDQASPNVKSGEIIYEDLHLTLPEEYTYLENQDHTVSIYLDENIVGGITQWDNPKEELNPGYAEGDSYQENNYGEWVSALGLPEAQEDASLTGYIGDTNWGDLEAEYWNGSNPEKYDVMHYFYIHGESVYDIWFDWNQVNPREETVILDSVRLAENEYPQSNAGDAVTEEPDIATDAGLVQYGALKMLLPSGFAAREQDGAIILTKDSDDIGGITSWSHPGFEPDDMIEWMKALGIPELQENYEVPIGYMAGGSSYGDYEIEIFWDGNPDALNIEHQFFVDGIIVYDIWFDQNLISDGIAERFLKTVAINADPVIEENPDEQAAFAKCRAVIEAVQQGSYKIVTHQSSGRDESTVRHEWIYSRNGDDWLSIANVLPMGADFDSVTQYSTTKSTLCVNGQRFSFTGAEWVEIANNDSSRLPWLAEFTWDENVVAYMDTLIKEEGECVMLRVDEQYVDSDEYDPHYFVNFNFDPEGNFVNVELEVNLFRENELEITESIVTLDSETVNAEIQAEYQKAIG